MISATERPVTGSARYGQWTEPTVSAPAAYRLAEHLGVPPVLGAILVARGLDQPDQAAAFLDPRLNGVSDPFLIADMDRAVVRLDTALRQKERIAVFGDYDVDGIMASSLLSQILKSLGGEAFPFIPNRISEGYGFTPTALARCLNECQPSLIVTVDCGTGADATVGLARQAHCDVIITDHHTPAPPIAEAVADINPRRCAQPDLQALAGAGVAFKLCHALVKFGIKQGFLTPTSIDLRDWIDMVALGSVADMVPLTGENRIWVRHGLTQLDRTRHIGLKALMDTAKLNPPLSTSDIGFGMGPRLNAAGRLGSADDALALAMTTNADDAARLAESLDACNKRRRTLETRIQSEAAALISGRFDPKRDFGLALAGDDWDIGVVGIVASRLSRHYFRPTAIASFTDGAMGRGSCRSIEGVDMIAVLDACSPLLEAYGGHRMAAGFSIQRKAWTEFQTAFNMACREQLNGTPPVSALTIDAWLDSLDDATSDLHHHLQRLAPFGQNNPTPILGIKNLVMANSPRILSGRHLKFRAAHGRCVMDVIAFGMSACPLPNGEFDLAARLETNTYRGRTTLQWVAKDFRPAISGR